MGRRGLLGCLAAVAAGCGSGGGEPPAAAADPATWRTWALRAPGEVAVPAPAAAGTEAAAASERATERLRARAEQPDVRAAVRRWGASPAIAPWQELAMRFVAQRAKDPPAGSRAYALVGIASHDALVAAAHWQRVHGDPAHPSTRAAIAGASSAALAHAFPEHPRAGLEAMARQAADAAVARGAADRAAADAGLELGRRVAERAIARVRGDRVEDAPPVEPPRGRGMWAPPPGSTARPVQPRAGTWSTWLLDRGDAVRPAAPPPVGSEAFREEAQAVVDAKLALTPEQRRIARFWEGGDGTELPPGIWVRAVLAHLRSERVGDAHAARAMALVTAAMADAGVAAWDAKYAFWNPRPENAIRDIGLDPDWKPLLATPFFPAYPSGHATYSGAAAEVLEHLFPEARSSWRARAREAADSRIYGGIHYPMDGEAGLRMGRAVGRLAVERARADGAAR